MKNTYELVTFLQKEYPKMVDDMMKASHHYSTEFLNPFHLEGDVFCHTMMVMQIADQINASFAGKVACLTHDLGKPQTRKENHEKKRVSMYNHEAVSAFMAIEVMEKLDLSLKEKINIFFAVCYHIEFHRAISECKESYDPLVRRFPNQRNMIQILVELGISDTLGRFSDPTISEIECHLKDDAPKILDYIESSMSLVENKNVNNKPVIEMLIGLPCSGKSTYRSKKEGYTIICRDDIMTKNGTIDYREAFENHQKNTNMELDQMLKASIKNRENIVFDLMNLVKKNRNGTMTQAKGYYKKAVLFLESLPVIFERNENRGSKLIPRYVYENAMASFTPPNYEDFDEIVVVYCGQEIDLKDCF